MLELNIVQGLQTLIISFLGKCHSVTNLSFFLNNTNTNEIPRMGAAYIS